jgi:hypothetical protein
LLQLDPQGALETQRIDDLSQSLSLDFIRPRISTKSLRLAGIAASDSVESMMKWWPRVRLYTALKLCRRAAENLAGLNRVVPFDSVSKVLDVLAGILGAVHWAAKDSKYPADLIAIDGRIRSEQDPSYRTTGAGVVRSGPTPKAELDITENRLMTIDLSRDEGLVTYPAGGHDWSVKRQQVLLLQTAIQLGFDWADVVAR